MESCILYGSGFLQMDAKREGTSAFATVAVTIGSCFCEYQILSDETIKLVIPSQLPPGLYRVVVRVGNYSSSFQHARDATIRVTAAVIGNNDEEVTDSPTDDFEHYPSTPEMNEIANARPSEIGRAHV